MAKADRSVSAFLKRLGEFHLQGGPPAFVEICRDICSGPLEGTNVDFTRLWETLVDEEKKMKSVIVSIPYRNAIKHVFQEKDRVAPNPIEVAPSLMAVKVRRR